MGQPAYGRMRLQLCRRRCGRHLSGDGQGAQKHYEKELHPCAGIRRSAIVNSSRGIIAAYKQDKYAKFGPEGYADASRQAVLDMIEDIQVGAGLR